MEDEEHLAARQELPPLEKMNEVQTRPEGEEIFQDMVEVDEESAHDAGDHSQPRLAEMASDEESG